MYDEYYEDDDDFGGCLIAIICITAIIYSLLFIYNSHSTNEKLNSKSIVCNKLNWESMSMHDLVYGDIISKCKTWEFRKEIIKRRYPLESLSLAELNSDLVLQVYDKDKIDKIKFDLMWKERELKLVHRIYELEQKVNHTNEGEIILEEILE